MAGDSLPWLLLHYKLPTLPSASRVRVWRKLKRLGAVLWLDSAWVLPDTAHTHEQFHWLAAEIVELKGEAALWLAQSLAHEQDIQLAGQFAMQTDAVYQQLLTQLEAPDANLASIAGQYQQARQMDYFHSALGERLRKRLVQQRGGKRP